MNAKRLVVGVICGCLLGAIAYGADVTLSILVPDAYGVRLFDAINTIADKEIILLVQSKPGDSDNYSARWDFTIKGKQGGETNQDWAERYTAQMLKASMRLYEYRESEITREAAIAALDPADVNVPDDAIQ